MPTFRYCTKAQFGLALRERFREARGRACIDIITWFLAQSDTDLKNWFNLTQLQLNQFKARCNTKLTYWDNLVGE